jgi:ABC-2 type transport system ATP-binding protein
MLIETENLNAGYGTKTVLHDVSLSFEGGAVGLLGPNGAGKSTLLKTLLGFLPPLGGIVRVMDFPVPARAREVRARVGYMPEIEAFIPGMNAVHFVAYMGELSGLPRSAAMERAHEVLQYVGLGEARYRNLETYSMGMKQRAKLAQAIVHDPGLLLLDEPTNGMDPQGRIEMLELVGDLAANKGMSVILCSHLLKDVESVAREIIVLGNGRILYKRMLEETGQPADAAYSVRVRGNCEAFVHALEARAIGLLDGSMAPNLFVRLGAGVSTGAVFEAAVVSGCVIQRLERQTEKLEDLFVQAIGELGDAHL